MKQLIKKFIYHKLSKAMRDNNINYGNYLVKKYKIDIIKFIFETKYKFNLRMPMYIILLIILLNNEKYKFKLLNKAYKFNSSICEYLYKKTNKIKYLKELANKNYKLYRREYGIYLYNINDYDNAKIYLEGQENIEMLLANIYEKEENYEKMIESVFNDKIYLKTIINDYTTKIIESESDEELLKNKEKYDKIIDAIIKCNANK